MEEVKFSKKGQRTAVLSTFSVLLISQSLQRESDKYIQLGIIS